MTTSVPSSFDDQSLPAADTAAPAVPALPDRADAPVSETSERFLRAVMAEIPLDRLEELHMFSPLRQGTVETGIAVLAVRVPVIIADAEAELVAATPEPELALDEHEATDASALEPVEADPVEAELVEAELIEVEPIDTEPVHAEAVEAELVEVEQVDAEAVDTEPVEAELAEAEQTDIEAAEVPERPVRHTVYTARYRHVIKGPERGKWESSVKAEAEAPLITVETVVRGVQRRAGEESEIIRYTAPQVAKILRIPFPVAAVGA